MSDVERIEYRPVSVRETLIQMKDISELMIDLAYSAALFNNKALAEEVIQLEKRMDDLVYVLSMNLMLAASDKNDAETLAGGSKIGNLTNNISDAAADIAGLVLNDIRVHPIVREVFKRAEEHLARMLIAENSWITGKTIYGLDLAAEVGVDIIAIRRGEHWFINPDKELLMPEDVILARGTASGLEKLKRIATGEAESFD
ncbi:potassium channel protein [Candidatus Bathyarchaeota archaeon]|nr:potassium channel protein [Candidatus Bathyarchaeota archaeon]